MPYYEESAYVHVHCSLTQYVNNHGTTRHLVLSLLALFGWHTCLYWIFVSKVSSFAECSLSLLQFSAAYYETYIMPQTQVSDSLLLYVSLYF